MLVDRVGVCLHSVGRSPRFGLRETVPGERVLGALPFAARPVWSRDSGFVLPWREEGVAGAVQVWFWPPLLLPPARCGMVGQSCRHIQNASPGWGRLVGKSSGLRWLSSSVG